MHSRQVVEIHQLPGSTGRMSDGASQRLLEGLVNLSCPGIKGFGWQHDLESVGVSTGRLLSLAML
jgi:hypothetical protein